MTTILDCTTCGGPMVADRRCCPHCHCKNGHLKRIALVAAIGLGAGCGGKDANVSDLKKADMGDMNGGYPELDAAYGPAPGLDLSTPDGGDAGD